MKLFKITRRFSKDCLEYYVFAKTLDEAIEIVCRKIDETIKEEDVHKYSFNSEELCDVKDILIRRNL